MARPTFELAKWYADCISGEGGVLIAYSSRLRHRRLAVQYESLLSPHGATHSLRRSAIACSPDCIQWSGAGLGVCGRWDRCDAEIRETVFQSEEGVVEWHCVMPKAAARMEVSSRHAVTGLGYVERLRLTVPPWRLPIHRLRWGRFLSPRNTLVWIDWEGAFRTRLVYWNGRRTPALAVENSGLEFENRARLELDCGLVLRRGQLGSSVLHAIPGLERIAPAGIFLTDECKWRSRATLACAGQETDSGWCIHEEVTWP
jgi:hypothetical protein